MLKVFLLIFLLWLLFMWLTTKETRDNIYALTNYYGVRAIICGTLVATLLFFVVQIF